MTKRDFFRIIIKLFGLYSLILAVFVYFPNNLSYVIYDFEPITLLWIIGALSLTVLVFVFLIRKTDRIIDLLKIDKGFDEERIEFGNFNVQNILKLGLILIGGFLIIDYFPHFLHFCYLAFKGIVASNGIESMHNPFGGTLDYSKWTLSAINLILGYMLLTNFNRISNWIFLKDKTLGNNK